ETFNNIASNCQELQKLGICHHNAPGRLFEHLVPILKSCQLLKFIKIIHVSNGKSTITRSTDNILEVTKSNLPNLSWSCHVALCFSEEAFLSFVEQT
ncbi:15844_t:CDS:1, partial [Gigaspora margarita]